jgi:hypothetical protein
VDRYEEVRKRATGRVAFQCLMNDPRLVNTIEYWRHRVLETPFPEARGQAITLLESLCRRR